MRCAVLNCTNNTQNNTERISFHGFPTEKKILHAWVAFTGRLNFVPNFSSKICSAHFEDEAYILKPKKLKANALPTLYGETGENSISQDLELHTGDSQISRSDPLACILNPDTAISKVQLVRENLNENFHLPGPPPLIVSQSNKIFNTISSEDYLHPTFTTPSDTIVLNYNRNASGAGTSAYYMPMHINVPVNFLHMQMPGFQVPSQGMSTALTLSNQTSQQQISYTQRNIHPPLGPIKVVDMKKLLQTPPKSDTQTCTLKEMVPTLVTKNDSWPTPESRHKLPNVQQVEKTKVLNTSLKVTISQVLDCLKVILPVKFDLSKLIPNEKVASLVIRYLKLTDSSEVRNSVNLFLKIIVDASKTKEKVHGNDLSHPYLKINDVALQLALEKVLPSNFSMSDLSNQVLNCLCIVLNQDIFSDGHHILRRKIRQFTTEGQKFSEIINQVSRNNGLTHENAGVTEKAKHSKLLTTTKKSPGTEFKKIVESKLLETQLSNRLREKCISDPAVTNSQTKSNVKNKSRKLSGSLNIENNERLQKFKSKVFIDKSLEQNHDLVYIESSSDGELSSNNTEPSSFKIKVIENDKKSQNRVGLDNEKEYCSSEKTSEVKGPKNLRAIVSYLEKHQCSAKDVLVNFRLMFYLCRYLNIKSKQPTLQKLKESLNLILEKNINKENVNQIEEELNLQQQIPLYKVTQKGNQYKVSFVNVEDTKLRLNPVVLLHNLVDFRKEDMLFMKEEKRKMPKQNGYYNQRVPFCFQQNISTQKYSTDYVKKLTHESYKLYRKIISRKVGNKVVFRLRYTKLEAGSHVFVRDFRNPASGWLKGTVDQMKGPLKCQVQLESGEKMWCVMEQLRPIPDAETLNSNQSGSPRVPRLVKPKQLFDL